MRRHGGYQCRDGLRKSPQGSANECFLGMTSRFRVNRRLQVNYDAGMLNQHGHSSKLQQLLLNLGGFDLDC